MSDVSGGHLEDSGHCSGISGIAWDIEMEGLCSTTVSISEELALDFDIARTLPYSYRQRPLLNIACPSGLSVTSSSDLSSILQSRIRKFASPNMVPEPMTGALVFVRAAVIDPTESCVPTSNHANTTGDVQSHRLLIVSPMPIVELDDAEVEEMIVAKTWVTETQAI